MAQDIFLHCERCDVLFASGIALGSGAHDITVRNCSSTCPKCRTPIPFSGTFSAITNRAIELISSKEDPLASARELRSLLEEIRIGSDLPHTLERVRDQYGDIVPRPRQGRRRSLPLILLIVALSAIIWWYESRPDEDVDTEDPTFKNQFNTYIEQHVDQRFFLQSKEERHKVIPFKNESPKIGRNAPCLCGSGKKFKKCCGF